MNKYVSAEHALEYLERADHIPHRKEGEAMLLEIVPRDIQRFQNDATIEIIDHNLDTSLPALGTFDAVVSSLAIHHCEDTRKRELYIEIFAALVPGGTFCNLEHVSSPSETLHRQFYQALGKAVEEEDPANKLLDVETQLRWLREIGFIDVDCLWKWREIALLVGKKPLAD